MMFFFKGRSVIVDRPLPIRLQPLLFPAQAATGKLRPADASPSVAIVEDRPGDENRPF